MKIVSYPIDPPVHVEPGKAYRASVVDGKGVVEEAAEGDNGAGVMWFGMPGLVDAVNVSEIEVTE